MKTLSIVNAVGCIGLLSTTLLGADVSPQVKPSQVKSVVSQKTPSGPGDVTAVAANQREVLVKCQHASVRINFWSDDVVRMQMSEDGSFSNYDDAKAFMIQPGLTAFPGVTPKVTETTESLKLATDSLVMEVSKHPFGFRFLKSDGKSVLAEGTLEKGVRAVFIQDACGREEHYFGLQNEKDNALDQRGRTVRLHDENGAGWSAPFVMSTAGYGLFLNNEYSKETQFILQQPVVIENTAAKGAMDLFFIAGSDLKKILGAYTKVTGRPGMPPRKLLGFQYLVKGHPVMNEGEFPQWVERGYPIDSCITFTDQKVEETNEIEAVAATAGKIHQLNGFFGFYYDLPKWPGTFSKTKPEPTKWPYEGWDEFKTLVRSRLLDNGVDWFWIDETDSGANPRKQNNLYAALKEAQESHGNRRSFNCARGGYAGAQRFGYPWMGDVYYDRIMMISNLGNGLAGFAHSTHDMSGAVISGQTDAQYLNGVKCNLLNPLSQCNNWVPLPPQQKTHLPWQWTPEVEQVFRKFLDLHYQLIPYFYTMAWQAHTAGLPAWRALVMDNPDDQVAYSSDEVMIGDWLLMAPLYHQSERPVYLPKGKWYYLFDGTMNFTGPTHLGGVQAPNSEYPLFVKAGAIIPLMPTMRYVGEKPVDPLTVLIYPLDSGSSSYEIYEDDGSTRDYLKGSYCTTRIECEADGEKTKVIVQERKGLFKPAGRTRILSVFQDSKPKQVEVDGTVIKESANRGQLDAVAEGWGYWPDALTGVSRVFVKTRDEGGKSEVVILRDRTLQSQGRPKLSAVFDNAESQRINPVKDTPSHGLFVKEDRQTGGTWKGVYGKDGYLIAGSGRKLPEGTEVRFSAKVESWQAKTSEARALQREPGEGRVAAGYRGRNLIADVFSASPHPRKVTLYLLDWGGREKPKGAFTTKICAMNPITGAIYDERCVEAYTNGIYLTYEVTGNVSFVVDRIKGHSAVLSGIFLD